jgi:hypothetical protein
MVHLRATGQVRIQVVVMDVKKIPKMADVCAISSIYRLYFKPDEVVQHDASDLEDDDLLDDAEKDTDGGDREMEDAEDPDPTTENDNNGTCDKSPAPLQNMPPQQQASLVNKALDTTCEQLIDEISFKVMLELEDGTEEEWTTYNNFVNSPNKFEPSSVFWSPPLEGGDDLDATLHCSVDDDATV